MENAISTENILKMAQSFMECRIFHAAAELNLFTILAKTPLSAGQVAAKVQGDARALSFLLDALAAMGLLSKRGQTYLCEASVAQLLSENSPQTILPIVLHMASLWKRWSYLTDIAKGIGGAKEEYDFSRNAEELRSFIGAMHAIGAPLAKRIVEAVNPGDSRALLDVGGGSGTYTIAFLRAVPEMKATLFDLPEVLKWLATA